MILRAWEGGREKGDANKKVSFKNKSMESPILFDSNHKMGRTEINRCQAYTVDICAFLTKCPNHAFHPMNG